MKNRNQKQKEEEIIQGGNWEGCQGFEWEKIVKRVSRNCVSENLWGQDDAETEIFWCRSR